MLSIDREAMLVLALNGTFVTVARGQNATAALPHVSGAVVFAGSPDWFYSGSPSGSCTTASTLVTPYVNILTGQQWLCSTLSLGWAPGWQNTSFPPNVTAAVASAAGVVVPSGPLFHITGALAITGFTLPLGFSSGSFTVIPDGAFTTTTATNVAIASTAVVGKALVFTYDQVAGKFYPSY
jgi:hypothetical protein